MNYGDRQLNDEMFTAPRIRWLGVVTFADTHAKEQEIFTLRKKRTPKNLPVRYVSLQTSP